MINKVIIMKGTILVIFLGIVTSCIGQTNYKQYSNPEKLIYVENVLFQFSKIEERDTAVTSSLWDEFNENIEDRIPIPEKIFVKTFFHINSEWAGEQIPLGKVYYKTTIQFIFGNIVIGANICNPIVSKEIQLSSGAFSGKDFEKMFLNNSNFSGLIFETPVFLLRDYLTKNKVSIFNYNGNPKLLGRIVIRTYLGRNNNKLDAKYENIINVMRNPYFE